MFTSRAKRPYFLLILGSVLGPACFAAEPPTQQQWLTIPGSGTKENPRFIARPDGQLIYRAGPLWVYPNTAPANPYETKPATPHWSDDGESDE